MLPVYNNSFYKFDSRCRHGVIVFWVWLQCLYLYLWPYLHLVLPMAHALLEEGNNQNLKWTVHKIYRKFKKRNFVTSKEFLSYEYSSTSLFSTQLGLGLSWLKCVSRCISYFFSRTTWPSYFQITPWVHTLHKNMLYIIFVAMNQSMV